MSEPGTADEAQGSRARRRWWGGLVLAVVLLGGVVGVLFVGGGSDGGADVDDEDPAVGDEAGEAGDELPVDESAEPTSPLSGEVRWTTYSSLNLVKAVAPTPDGGVWTGTESGGVVRWDADGRIQQQHPFGDGLGPDRVRSIALGEDGALWVATQRPRRPHGEGDPERTAVARFDGGWTEWTPADGVGHDHVTAVATGQDGAVWAATPGGISRFDGQSWQTWTAEDGLAATEMTAISVGENGTVWAAGAGGVARFADGGWITETVPARFEEISAVTVADDGALWVATPSRASPGDGGIGSVARFDGEEWTTWAADEGPPTGRVLSLASAGDAVWAATRAGMAHFDGEEWASDIGDGRVDNAVFAVGVGDDGTVWAGTDGGLSRFAGREWTSMTADRGLPTTSAFGVAAHDGVVWVATGVDAGKGVSRFDGDRWITHTSEDGLAHDGVGAVTVADDGTVWASSAAGGGTGEPEGGVSRFDGEQWAHWTTSGALPHDEVTALAAGADGTVWVATRRVGDPDTVPEGGVSRFDGEQWTHWTADDGLAADGRVDALAVDGNDTVWAATHDGLSHFDGDSWTLHTADDGLPATPVVSVAAGGDAVWANTLGGLSRYDGEQWAGPDDAALRLDADDPFGNDPALQVAVNEHGTLWTATTDEARDVLAAFDGEEWARWTTDERLSPWVNGLSVADDGTVWIATNAGVTRLDGE